MILIYSKITLGLLKWYIIWLLTKREKGAKFLNDLYRNFIKVPEDLFQEIKWEFYEGDDTKGEVLMEDKWPIPQYTNYLKVNIYSL